VLFQANLPVTLCSLPVPSQIDLKGLERGIDLEHYPNPFDGFIEISGTFFNSEGSVSDAKE